MIPEKFHREIVKQHLENNNKDMESDLINMLLKHLQGNSS